MAKPQDVGEAEIQAKFDQHHEQGFVGQRVDPEPNSAYTAPQPAPPKTKTKKESKS